MNPPHFSVIMPVYNAAPYLFATIKSVLTQTDGDLELILVDDGSTDESLGIMLSLASEDARIKLVSQSNQGVSAARNLGLSQARGKLVAFMDADDLWKAEKLEMHGFFHARHPHVAASYAQIAFIYHDAKPGDKAKTYSTVTPGPLTVEQVIAENPTCTMSNLVVVKETIDAVGGFRSDMSYAEDQEWIARLVSFDHDICGMDHHLVDYRMSPNGLSVDLSAMHAGWRSLANLYADHGTVPSAEAIYCRYLSRRALRAGAPAKVALSYAMQGIRSDRLAFLKDARRGWLTLISAVAALLIPRSARIQFFA
ncbi:glycosyltransferase family A protein [Sphingopyxis sp. BSNA05]|uniref:glycosyltransferase family 2 protein n=1 Tax=Sphingopyxis sp. BSNA05 TaxID=1236614 RepID=UPI0015668119|nr:glycosyltransferase family A protein [Sphingopyxis sp. BSNA05]